jgi:hypothetical protein
MEFWDVVLAFIVASLLLPFAGMLVGGVIVTIANLFHKD